MKETRVALPPDLDEFVRRLVDGQRFTSTDEVICAALRLLEDQEDLRRIRLDKLRKEVQIGIDQADRGELAPLDINDIQARVRASLSGNGTTADAKNPAHSTS